MNLVVPYVYEENVTIKVADNTVFFNGSIDCMKPQVYLKPFFNELHKRILESKKKNIKINLVKLKYLNSRGIKEFVAWIVKLFALPPDKQYNISFLYTSQYTWQKLTLNSLILLNPDRVSKICVQ